MDHSGITMSVGSGRFSACDPQGWDWGMVGFIFVSKSKIREEYSLKRVSKKSLKKAEELLCNEVETYDSHIRGDCYGYIIKDSDDLALDSCWGFVGYKEIDYMLKECKSIIDHHIIKIGGEQMPLFAEAQA
jgi:hypothetical protein